MYVTVFPDKYIAGWDGQTEAQFFPTVTLEEALSKHYNTDAHFSPYWGELQDENGVWSRLDAFPRLTIAAIPYLDKHKVRVRFGYGVIDVDCADVHRGRLPEAPDDWRDEMHGRVQKLAPGALSYDTRGGLRMIWRLPAVLDREQYTATIKAAVAIARKAGIPADMLPDFGRLHRAPFTLRDGVHQRYPNDIFDPAPWSVASAAEAASAPVHVAEARPKSPFAGITEAYRRFELPENTGEGSRHYLLTRAAASLRAKSTPPADLEAALRVVDKEKCSPPMTSTPEGEDEFQRIVAWALGLEEGTTAQQDARRQPALAAPKPLAKAADDGEGVLDDDPAICGQLDSATSRALHRGDSTELAQILLSVLEHGGVRTVFDLGALWLYSPTTGCWQRIDRDFLLRTIMQFAGMSIVDEKRIRALHMSARTAEDVYRTACTLRSREGFFMGARPGVAFLDAFVLVDPTRGPVRTSHSPDNRCRWSYDFPWTDDVPTEFLGFLDDVWALEAQDQRSAMKAALCQWCGLVILGRITSFEKIVTFCGSGSNGKSQTIWIVEGCFPKGTVTNVKPQEMGQEYYRAMLANSCLNVVSEVPSTEISSEAAAALKGIASGENMTGRHIRGAPFNFRARCGVMLALNDFPTVRDSSNGYFRKQLVFPFSRTFIGPEIKPDIGKNILAGERAAIVCWMIRSAAVPLATGRLEVPQVSDRMVREWREGHDEVEQWLRDNTATNPSGTAATELYADFRLWSEQNGLKALSNHTFGSRLKAKIGQFFIGSADNRKRAYPLELLEKRPFLRAGPPAKSE
jgi:hypothetical protein